MEVTLTEGGNPQAVIGFRVVVLLHLFAVIRSRYCNVNTDTAPCSTPPALRARPVSCVAWDLFRSSVSGVLETKSVECRLTVGGVRYGVEHLDGSHSLNARVSLVSPTRGIPRRGSFVTHIPGVFPNSFIHHGLF